LNNIDELLKNDLENRHSNFQISNFIIGKQGDPWAQYKQCLIEIKGRLDNLEKLKEDAEILKIKMEEKRFYFPTKNNVIKKRLRKRRADRQLQNILSDIIGTEREMEAFINLAKKLKEEIGELTEEKRYQLETKSWAAKGLKMAAIDILASGRISNQTYDFLFALPKESMVDIIRKLSSKKPMELLGFESEVMK